VTHTGRLDLLAAVAWGAAAALVVLVLPDAAALRVAFGVPLVLVVPGYALAAAVFAGDPPERAALVMWTIALSVAACILVTLALDVAGVRLTGVAFACALAGTTAAGAAAAALRRRGAAAPRLGRVPLRWAAVIAVAAAVFAGLFAALRQPLPNTAVPGYTQLSGLRSPDGGIRLKVTSAEQARARFRLSVTTGERTLRAVTLDLRPGQSWTGRAGSRSTTRARDVEVRLTRADAATDRAYRRLILRP
jgi:hypothetical protein